MKIIRFTASWCGPCKMLSKTLENLETNIPIDVVDIDVHPEVALEYGIRGVPTLVLLDEHNQPLRKLVGNKPLNELKEWING